uniref:(California timema) hypothetical protein n=1 Tax=Timema californicum TaxID=61474 RepID=A0A7R9JCN3_TIMCA|nr:unnamed protein product [Timema californicum]
MILFTPILGGREDKSYARTTSFLRHCMIVIEEKVLLGSDNFWCTRSFVKVWWPFEKDSWGRAEKILGSFVPAVDQVGVKRLHAELEGQSPEPSEDGDEDQDEEKKARMEGDQ